MSLDFHFDTLHPKVRENRFFQATGQLARENEKKFSNPLDHKQVSKIGLLFERKQEAATPTFPPESYVFLRRKHLFPSRESIFSSERKRNPFREHLAARLLTAHDPAATPSRWAFSPHINAHP